MNSNVGAAGRQHGRELPAEERDVLVGNLASEAQARWAKVKAEQDQAFDAVTRRHAQDELLKTLLSCSR